MTLREKLEKMRDFHASMDCAEGGILCSAPYCGATWPCDACRLAEVALVLLDAMVLDFHPGGEPCAYCAAKDKAERILEGR